MGERVVRVADGADLLAAYLKREDVSDVAAGKALGVTSQTVLAWRTGVKRPNDHHRDAIQAWSAFAVPVDAWRFPEERAALQAITTRTPAVTAAGS